MKRCVILISGRGSNMEALFAAQARDELPIEIANRADAKGLASAAAWGVATRCVPHKDCATREAFDAALAEAIDTYAPDLVILAGFMRILTPHFVAHYAGRMMNIHPSLLPAFPGLHTHARALAAGCKLAGATVHWVTAELDHGPIIIQGAVPVMPADDEDRLAARVLKVEHEIFPKAVRWFAQGRLREEAGIVWVVDPVEPQLIVRS